MSSLLGIGPSTLLTKLCANEPESRRRNSWQPIWLRKTTLFAFLVLFISLAMSLILIRHLAARDQGLPMSISDNYYSWMYGPTAVLVVVVGLWRRVNYCVMVNQPWQELFKGPQAAEKAILLDYLSPPQISSFITALKNGHFAVAATISIFVLLKVIIVISTTLFSPEYAFFSQPVELSIKSKFNSSLFWNTAPMGLSNHGNEGYLLQQSDFRDGISYHNISADPVRGYMNLRRKYPNMDPPAELSKAFAEFSIIPDLPGDGLGVSALVDVFQPKAACEVVDVDWYQDHSGKTVNLTLHTPSCGSDRVEIPVCPEEPGSLVSDPVGPPIDMPSWLRGGHPNGPRCPSKVKYFMVERVNCTGEHFPEVFVDESTPNTYQYAMISVESNVSSKALDHDIGGWDYDAQIQRVVAVSCNLTYSMHKGIAKGSAQDTSLVDSLEVLTETSADGIFNLTQLQFSEAVFSSLQTGSVIFNPSQNIVRPSTGAATLLGLMADSTSNGTVNAIDVPFEPQSIKHSVEHILAGVSQQVVRHYFLAQDDVGTRSTGTVEYSQLRLQTRSFALWTMIGLFALAAALVLVVIIHNDQIGTPPSPDALATSAFMLLENPAMSQIIHGTSAKRLSQIRQKVRGLGFTSIRDGDGAIQTKPTEVSVEELCSMPSRASHPETPCLPRANSGRFWTPYAARKHAVTMTFSVPFILVAVLEVLWHFSKTDDDFVTVFSVLTGIALRYSSTAAMLLVASLLTSLDFVIATLTPFSVLASGKNGASAESSMLFSIVGDLPPVAIYKTIGNRHYGASLSLIASTIGSLLTVVVSGIWYFDTSISIAQAVNANIQSGWKVDFGALNSAASVPHSTGDLTLFDQIQHGGIESGSLVWNNSLVWDSIVLPIVGNPRLSETASSTGLRRKATGAYEPTYFNFKVTCIESCPELFVSPGIVC